LAFFGVLIVAPAVLSLRVGKGVPKTIPRLLVETLSVLLVTTPYTAHIFGIVPIYAVLANIAVVPFVPLAMAGTVLAGAVGFVGQDFYIVAKPAELVMTYMLDVSSVFQKLPGSQWNVSISTAVMVGMYVSVAGMVYIMRLKRPLQLETSLLS
jgi:competence protein ComEC